MAGLRGFTISLIAIFLCVSFVILFAFNFIGTTNPSSEVFNPIYGLNQSVNSYNTVLGTFNNLANDVNAQMGSSEPSATDYLFLIFRGAFTIPYTFLIFLVGGINVIKTSLFAGVQNIGISNTVLAGTLVSAIMVLGSVLIITVVLLIIKSIRTGESER